MRLWDWFCVSLFVALLLALSGRSLVYVTRIWQEWHGHLQMTVRPDVHKSVQNCVTPTLPDNQAEYYLYQYYRLDQPCAN